MKSSQAHSTARNGHSNSVGWMMNLNVNAGVSSNLCWTPLHPAAGNGRLAVVKQLLSKGAKTQAQSDNGWDPLHSVVNSP